MARLFGTDGVRGVANEELTPLLAMQLGQAGAYVLTKENKHKPTIMVGCDTRISGDMLANALMAGVCSVGANAVYVGVVPTPAVAYLTKKYRVDAGVVISASHNPVEFNGIKFFDGNGYKLPDSMEDEIEELIKNNMQGIKFPNGAGIGKVKYRSDAREEYINHSMKSVPVDLKKMKIVVDCAEGAAYYTSVETLKELGADVVAIHNSPDGTNINANCGSTHMQELMARVVYEKAMIDFSKFLTERVEYFEDVAEGNKLHIITDIKRDLFIVFNEIELQRICDNNLSNAIKYSYEKQPLHVKLYAEQQSVVFEVQNSGEKIKAPEQLFNRYYREDEARGGFGLGLNIVKEICDANDVSITVLSDESKTLFRYRFAKG